MTLFNENRYDQFGQLIISSDDLCDLLYKNPELDISIFKITDPCEYNNGIKSLHSEWSKLNKFANQYSSVEEFDHDNHADWFISDNYKNFPIEEWLINQCSSDIQLARVQEEIILFKLHNMFDVLIYLKYLIDTLRDNKIVWGLGRGSSVASYCLYLIGVHKIDSIKYNLDWQEFLR